ncbi:hypothetical protein RSAG8_04404, partial [Rhizoctonia solani AG-8 WAC10335]
MPKCGSLTQASQSSRDEDDWTLCWTRLSVFTHHDQPCRQQFPTRSYATQQRIYAMRLIHFVRFKSRQKPKKIGTR